MGAQKAGTTTLHELLSRHPDVFLPKQKETKFFADNSEHQRGLEYYRTEYFNGVGTQSVVGEVDPEYLYFPYVASRIHEFCERARLLFLFRNPIDRAYSHYLMSVRRGFEKIPFEEAISFEERRLAESYWNKVHFSYVDRGFYSRQLKKYIGLFPMDQCLFVLTEDLKENLQRVMDEIADFLEVVRFEIPADPIRANQASRARIKWLAHALHGDRWFRRGVRCVFGRKGRAAALVRWIRDHNWVPGGGPEMKVETRRHLRGIYRDDIEELAGLIGRDLDHWLS